MHRIVCDLESDGFVDQLTKIHCLVIRDVDSWAVLSCADQPGHPPISEGLSVIQHAERSYWHNGIDFDIPALRKVYPNYEIDESKIRDTLLMSRMCWGNIADSDYDRVRRGRLPGKYLGRFSLAAWGYRLGVLKGDFGETTDWSVWTPEMQVYCAQDTSVTVSLVAAIRRAAPPGAAVETEHELAWYLSRQKQNGVPFDMDKAVALCGKLAARRDELAAELQEQFGEWLKFSGEFTPKRSNSTMGYVAGVAVSKVKRVGFNPTSRDHIASRLIKEYGWVPTVFTPSGKPKVDEDTLAGLPYPPCAKLIEYLRADKMLGQLSEGKEGWLRCATKEGAEGGALTRMSHIHGSINQCGAITHRGTHSHPNLGQVPKVGSLYGQDCRELFTVPDGWVMLGADVSGLELRCLGHYLHRYDDGQYADTVVNGDVHTLNMNVLGLTSRDKAKTWIYAWLYGAGDVKLGSIAEPLGAEAEQKALGAKLRARFLKGLPAMRMLGEAVKNTARGKGYLKLVDGRKVFVRSEHAALNSLLQGSGALICKNWIVEFNSRMVQEFGPQGWEGQWSALLWVHDEIQAAVRPAISERAMSISVASIEAMGPKFGFKVPLTGAAKLGANWAETH
jgi:hypothetical protein